MVVPRGQYMILVDIELQKRLMLILSLPAILYYFTPPSSMLRADFPSDRQSLVLRLQVCGVWSGKWAKDLDITFCNVSIRTCFLKFQYGTRAAK